jgi:hypothetical protein
MFHIPEESTIANFAFFGTILGYNFVKYDALARVKKVQMKNELKAIAFLSFLSFIFVAYYFFQLQRTTQIVAVCFLGLTLLYTLPFFPNRKNARNWKGIKIYIVALSWVGATLILPILNAEIAITFDFYLKCVQRFLLIFILILIFEIIDLQFDDPNLKTVPQQIGVKRTKIIGILLLVMFYFLEFFKQNFIQKQLLVNLVLVATISVFLLYANEKRSKYYSSFWVESIPILWWILLLIFR